MILRGERMSYINHNFRKKVAAERCAVKTHVKEPETVPLTVPVASGPRLEVYDKGTGSPLLNETPELLVLGIEKGGDCEFRIGDDGFNVKVC